MTSFHNKDGMFQYYLTKNITLMEDEHERLVKLNNAGLVSPKMQEYIAKKEAMVKEWIDNGNVIDDLIKHKEFKELLNTYKDEIYNYDVNNNKINSFLIEEDEYELVPIPYRYIPTEVERELFEFLYMIIEEDIGHLIGRA
jgi:predicted CopG family antitoxin